MNSIEKIILLNNDYFNRIVKALELIENAKDDLPIQILDDLEKVLRGLENVELEGNEENE